MTLNQLQVSINNEKPNGDRGLTVLIDTGPFIAFGNLRLERTSAKMILGKSSRSMGAYETTQKCTGLQTGSPLSRSRKFSRNQQPPILVMGDPIGDQGWAHLSTR
nr:unnamed protein product [Haemonchus contortus]